MHPREGLTGSVKILAACGKGLPVVPPLLCLPGAWKGAWSWGVKLSTAAVPRHLSRCKFGHISSFPHSCSDEFVFHFAVVLLVSSPVTSVTRLSRSPLICWRPKCKEWEGRPNSAIDPDCYETSRCVRMKKNTTTYNNNAGNKKQHRL